jgi:VanZ family protein
LKLWRESAFAWALAIGIVSLIPPVVKYPPSPGFDVFNLVAHFFAYLVLAALLRKARQSADVYGMAFAYGLAIEFVQPMFDRRFGVDDLLMNLLGITLAAVAIAASGFLRKERTA